MGDSEAEQEMVSWRFVSHFFLWGMELTHTWLSTEVKLWWGRFKMLEEEGIYWWLKAQGLGMAGDDERSEVEAKTLLLPGLQQKRQSPSWWEPHAGNENLDLLILEDLSSHLALLTVSVTLLSHWQNTLGGYQSPTLLFTKNPQSIQVVSEWEPLEQFQTVPLH